MEKLASSTEQRPQRVVDLIESKGAKILYSAPFSPDLNPIENYFGIYKAFLKKHNDEMVENWEAVHFQALTSVNREIGISYFRRCGIPGSMTLKTENEKNIQLKNEIAMFVIVIIVMQALK